MAHAANHLSLPGRRPWHRSSLEASSLGQSSMRSRAEEAEGEMAVPAMQKNLPVCADVSDSGTYFMVAGAFAPLARQHTG